MLQYLLRLLLGYCRFTVQTADPVRLLNRLHTQGIYFWKPDARQTRISFLCTKKSAPAVYRLLSGMGITDISVKGRGLPFLLSTLHRKIVFAAVLLLVIGVPLVSRLFVAEITVTGNQSVTTESILKALQAEGVKEYAYVPTLPLKQARQQLLLSQPKLSWATLNLTGNRIEVVVHEKTQSRPLRSDEPCNIVAACDGVICRMEVLSGKQMVSGKTAVREGQLLVSGFSETETGKLSYLHAQATVIAEIELQKSYTVDLGAADYVPSGERLSRYGLLFFGKELPLYRKAALPEQPYTVEKEKRLLEFGAVMLPFGLQKDTYTMYKEQPSTLTVTDAKAILQQRFSEYELYELSDAAVLSKDFSMKQKGDRLTMTGVYRVQRDIAREVKIGVIAG